MKRLSLLLLLIALPMILGATTVTFTDPFPGTSCINSSCDVIGDADKFDIQQVVVTINNTTTTVDIYFNYGTTNTSLSGFSASDGDTLNVGDFFFTVNGVPVYAFSLTGHDGSPAGNGGESGGTVTAWTLYQILSATDGTMTASEVLGPHTGLYRPDEIVWIHNGGSSTIAALTTGTGTVVGGGDGTTTAEFHVTFSFTTPAGFLDSLGSNWGIHFASATCGNDIIDGRVSAPEPISMVLFGGGLLGLGLLRRRF